eukprot:2244339-Pyramimonas_sp.AAC.1
MPWPRLSVSAAPIAQALAEEKGEPEHDGQPGEVGDNKHSAEEHPSHPHTQTHSIVVRRDAVSDSM